MSNVQIYLGQSFSFFVYKERCYPMLTVMVLDIGPATIAKGIMENREKVQEHSLSLEEVKAMMPNAFDDFFGEVDPDFNLSITEKVYQNIVDKLGEEITNMIVGDDIKVLPSSIVH